MVKYKSIKVSDTTLRWIRRLKGIVEHASAEPISMDKLIGVLAMHKDYEVAQAIELTLEDESFEDYVARIDEKLGIIQNQNINEQSEIFNV